jgi:hypothetical protein
MRKGCHAQLSKPRRREPHSSKNRCRKPGASTRPLPGRPSLRYLKLEAKRRLAAGEFPALHEKRFPSLSASQVSTEQHVLLIAGIVSGLIAIAAWLLIARASQAGKNWARITGTVLFALATLDALGGLVNPVAVPVKILAFVIWLLGLIAVVRLWQAASTAYFKAPGPDRGPRLT